MRKTLSAVVLVALLVALGACGEDDSASPQDTPTSDAAGPYGTVEITGEPLPQFESAEGDPAVGQTAPTLEGVSPADEPVAISPGSDGPMIVVFLAHWCPHCQAELPRIVELSNDDGAIEGVPVKAVLTGTNPDAPNYPPGAWLEREGFAGDALLDDQGASAATSYGLSSYPYFVAVDAEGKVVMRGSGELDEDAIVALAHQAAGD